VACLARLALLIDLGILLRHGLVLVYEAQILLVIGYNFVRIRLVVEAVEHLGVHLKPLLGKLVAVLARPVSVLVRHNVVLDNLENFKYDIYI
jgi:hypothetical protein